MINAVILKEKIPLGFMKYYLQKMSVHFSLRQRREKALFIHSKFFFFEIVFNLMLQGPTPTGSQSFGNLNLKRVTQKYIK